MLPRLSLITLLILLPAVVTAFLLQNSNTCIAQFSKASLYSAANSNQVMSAPRWFQKNISVTAPSRGCHLITPDINKAIKGAIATVKIGMANIFVQHTSCSLTINENADPDVRRDMEVALNKIAPASWNHDGTFKHTMEGDDDMPGHLKSSLMGVSLNIPISDGRLALGTWQGIYLNEHRDQGGWGGGHTRRIVITLQGQSQ
jgi:secondary thiamine-phosphate synthase enzyme